MINWMFYPKTRQVDELSLRIVNVFSEKAVEIDSATHQLKSDDVLALIQAKLSDLDFLVETSKRKEEKINVPVLFGVNGKIEKYFDADAYNKTFNYVIEVEAGRAVTNYQFLKDFFEACVMYNVDYLCIAVRNVYRSAKDFEKVCAFFDTLYQSDRMEIPLKGLLIVGY